MVLHLMNLSQLREHSLLQRGVSMCYIHQSIVLRDHDETFDSFDHATSRRGHHVYTQESVTCNTMELVSYRILVGVCFTELEGKNIITEIDVVDSPDATGKMLENPGVTEIIRLE